MKDAPSTYVSDHPDKVWDLIKLLLPAMIERKDPSVSHEAIMENATRVAEDMVGVFLDRMASIHPSFEQRMDRIMENRTAKAGS